MDIRELQPTPVYDAYWRFAAERQQILMKRLRGDAPPWTTDPILQSFRFTNPYRATDRVSQYLIHRVIYDHPTSPQNTVFRVLLFKFFNKTETWQCLEDCFGDLCIERYNPHEFAAVLDDRHARGARVFSGAYIMPAGSGDLIHPRKHHSYFQLLSLIIHSGGLDRILDSKNLEDIYLTLRQYPMLGPFLAFQFAVDINYAPMFCFSEMDFVVAGPGALRGIEKCFVNAKAYSPRSVIEWVARNQDQEMERLGLSFQRVENRPLQLIDCQNLFCEIDKYARVRFPDVTASGDRQQIKQRFVRSHQPVELFLPPKWTVKEAREVKVGAP